MKKGIDRNGSRKKGAGKGSGCRSSHDDKFLHLRETIGCHFPKLWPAVEAGLSACATLLLADNANPTALIYVGPPSAGKTTVASMFDGAAVEGVPLVYRSDRFSTAAFVSHSANVSREKLGDIDLLPRIKGKVLLTPDLSTIFRGGRDELTVRLATITRVLDGQGFSTDSGTHGQRGYADDHLFTWIGCSTPFTEGVWHLMAQLGSRLFLYGMDSVAQPTLAELVQANTRQVSYPAALQQCRKCLHEFLESLFLKHQGQRAVQWDAGKNSESVVTLIAHFAQLLATMRAQISITNAEQVRVEAPHRANSILYNIARGHALVMGRHKLTKEDLSIVAKIALSSMPSRRRAVLEAFAQNHGNPLTVSAICGAAAISRHTVESVMKDEIPRLGIAQYDYKGNGRTANLVLSHEWAWWANGDVGELIRAAATWQKSGGVSHD